MARHGHEGLLAVWLSLALLGCPDDADDDVTGDDDVSGDDDFSGDDDDDSAGDDDSVHPSWPDWDGADLADADASLRGEFVGDWAGAYLFAPGDLNGDGLLDLAIGAPDNSEIATGSGKLYLVFGRATGWTVGEALADHPSIVGEAEVMEVGQSRWIGDVDGDGIDDLLVAPNHEAADGLDHTYLFRGRTIGWEPSMPVASADARVTDADQQPGDSGLGAGTFLGDVTGDGLDDVVTGSHWTYGGIGQIAVIAGPDLDGEVVVPDDTIGWLLGQPGNSLQGHALDGDIDGDGLDEFAAYAYGDLMGREYWVFFGRPVPFPHGVDAQGVADLVVTTAPDETILTLRVMGDTNGDGLDDLAIRYRIGAQETESIHLYFGRAQWPAILAPGDADVVLGAQGHDTELFASPGDVNGDGLADLLYAAPGVDPDEPTDAYLVLGRTGSWPATILPQDADVHFEPLTGMTRMRGWSLNGQPRPGHDGPYRGDLDGDGINEVFLRSSDGDDVIDGLANPGAVFVFAGRTTWPQSLHLSSADGWIRGTVAGEGIGDHERALVVDVNGDDRDDLLLSSAYAPEQGGVHIFFGHPRTP